jgi:hypothetical protein
MPDTSAPNPLGRRRPKAPAAPAADGPHGDANDGKRSHAEPGRPNPYPHRLSVDVDNDTYRALRLIAAQEGCRLIDIIRAGITHELNTRK